MRAAKAWGLRPSDLGLCNPEDDLTYIVAWESTEDKMAAWERKEERRKAEMKGRK